MYTIKILRIPDYMEWQPPADKPEGGAGPNIKGAWLAKRVTIEVTPKGAHGKKPGHAQGPPLKIADAEVYELLVPCEGDDVTEKAISQAMRDMVKGLPYKHNLENKEIEVAEG